MRRLPPEPQVGDRITAELVRELIRCIRERQLLKGPNYTLQTGPNGTYLKIDPPKAGGASPSSPLPWSFACTIEEGEEGEGGEGEEETRTGGWYNCRAQIGFDIWGSPDTDCSHFILGTDQCDDGSYYLEVVLANNTEGRESDAAEIKLAADMDSTASDYIGGIIRIFIGTVEDGKLTSAPHFNPVVYKYV